MMHLQQRRQAVQRVCSNLGLAQLCTGSHLIAYRRRMTHPAYLTVMQAEDRHRQLVSAAVARATDGVAAQQIAALEAVLAATRGEADRRVAALELELTTARQEAADLRQVTLPRGAAL